MSVASVSGRNRAARIAADPTYFSTEREAARKAAIAAKRRTGPKPLHSQYFVAWRAAGKPKDFPSMAEWLEQTT